MSAATVAGTAVLGALAGLAAVPVGRRAVGVGRAAPSRSTGVGAVGCGGPPVGPRRCTVAVAGAVVYGTLAVTRGDERTLPALLLVAAVGLVLAVTDLSALRLPDPLVGAVALGGGLGLPATASVAGEPGRLPTALLGVGLSLGGYLLLALLPGARLGFGDVKLAAALGFPLGWLGWPALRLGLLLPHLLAGVVVLVLLAAGRIRRDTPLPFGPAILAGAWLAAVLT
ncbi:prepilin peptidase [Micromonospora sp. NPDC051141]|uniref:prepilin peptidase n=1 Tax=Micromonospora sp. NPDC051141 TaxID=3364284 RepID=UPI0037B33BAD